jgi:hypothetical protein
MQFISRFHETAIWKAKNGHMSTKTKQHKRFIKPGIRGRLAVSLILLLLLIMMNGCTGFSPQHTEVPAFLDRAVFKSRGDLEIGVAVPTAEESKMMYGMELHKKKIQPIWLRIQNNSQHNYWLLPSGMDPEHFSPSEVAFGFRGNSTKTNQEIADHFQNLHFKNPIQSNSSNEGYILVNLDEGFKAVDVDLLAQNSVESFTFIFEDPEFKGDFRLINLVLVPISCRKPGRFST